MKSMINTLANGLLSFALLSAGLAMAADQPRPEQESLEDVRFAAARNMESAAQLFDSMFTQGLTAEERAKVHELLKDDYGFVAFPNVKKVGVGVSQIQGHGVMVFRDAKGDWKAPLPLLITGTSIGMHFAAISYDTLIPIREPLDMEKLFKQDIAFTGADSIGPLQAWGSTNSGIVAYTRAKGLSAGITQDTVHITLDQQAIAALYGIHIEPHELFSGKLEYCRKPLPAQMLIQKANEMATGAPLTMKLEPSPGKMRTMRKSDRKRQHILDTAYRVFQKHRFEKTTMSGITAEAGGSKTTV